MLSVLGTTTDGAGSIAVLRESTQFVAPDSGLYYANVRLTGLNALAATITAAIRVRDSGGTVLGESPSTVNPKLVVTATKAQILIGPARAKRGEKLSIGLLSSNALDTGVSIEVEWVDALGVTTLAVN